MNKKLDVLVTLVLALAAVGVSGTYVYRAFFSAPINKSGLVAETVSQWDDVVRTGHLLSGGEKSKSTIVVLSDMECPACRAFHEGALERILEKHDTTAVRVVFHHYPLDYHKMALPAAISITCISASENPIRWISYLFSQQDSLATKPLTRFASDYGVKDSIAFDQCLTRKEVPTEVELGREIAARVGASGTPTVMVNGYVLSRPPNFAVLDSMVSGKWSFDR